MLRSFIQCRSEEDERDKGQFRHLLVEDVSRIFSFRDGPGQRIYGLVRWVGVLRSMVLGLRLIARSPVSTSNRFTSLQVRVLSSFSGLLFGPKMLGVDLRFWQKPVELQMRLLRPRS